MMTSTVSRLKYGTVGHWIDGQATSGTGDTLPVHNPATGEVIAESALADAALVERAVGAARSAWPAWAGTPVKERVQVLYRYRELLLRHRAELAGLITEEHGKLGPEAAAEIDRAVELTEFACAIPQFATGEVLEVARGVECRLERFPVGVVASIVPFNFPVMVPHWTIPNAIALGNCLVLKPSERVPLSARRTAELLGEAGLPPGVFTLVNGARTAVEALCDHPAVAAVTFVGSTPTAQAVYRRATQQLKRALALGGAKNHLLVLPDADPLTTPSAVLNSAIGCAGQRCMAASVLVALPHTEGILEQICRLARAAVPGRDYGPVISRAARERIERGIAGAVADGARLLVDGREVSPPAGCADGFWIGPTILDQVTPGMRIADEEIFGPVLAVMRAGSLEDALALQQQSRYGNAASIFTRDGAAARALLDRASAGMLGVNIGVPVPREPFPFGGWNASKYGVGDITGQSAIEFFTQAKKTTVRWDS
jgi:malonate-semialdehyde dehydrogenase (acetylating)/methylmalonate-semialdehyde dehydrogenase